MSISISLDPRFNSLFLDKQSKYNRMQITNPQEIRDKISALAMEVVTAENLLAIGCTHSCGVPIVDRLKVLNQNIADLEHLWKRMNKNRR